MVGRIFIIVFLKSVDANVDCERNAACGVPIEESFRLSSNGSERASIDCSESLDWSLNRTPINESDGFSMGCSNKTAWLIKDEATLSDSGTYRLKNGPETFVFREVLVFSATLRTQSSDDGRHLGVLLQLQTPPRPPPEEQHWGIEAFSCPSAKTNIPKYTNGTRWRLLDVELHASKLCCHFNVSNGFFSKQYSITPLSAPRIVPCDKGMPESTQSQSSASSRIHPGITEPLSLGERSVSPQIKLLSRVMMTFVVNAVFYFV